MKAFFAIVLTVSALRAGNPPDAHWPQWRGPNIDGVAPTAVPVEWSENKNVAWKLDIPGRGHSSPIIWGDRIFLTTAIPSGTVAEPAAGDGGRGGPGGPPPGGGAGGPGGFGGRRGGGGPGGPGGPGGGTGSGIEHRFVLLAVDRMTGKIIWERTATSTKPHEGYHGMYGSFASNSPVTDGKLVYAFFGSRGIYAYDFDGKVAWKKDFDKMRMRLAFGEGVAPVLDGNKLILGFDQEENSHILVLDKRDGKELWRAPREEMSAWAQPLVVEVGGKRQLVVSATNKTRSYDLETGKLIWECAGLGANVIPAPVSDGSVVYVMSGFRNPNLLAIKLGRTGDLTGTDAILWTNQRGNSYTPSPVLADGKLYFVSDNGLLSCLNAATGQPYYLQQRLPKPYSFKASPVAAGGKLYLSTEDGDVVVVKTGEKYEVLATNHLSDEMFVASPAVAGNSLYLRNQKSLYCIREAGK